MNNANDKTDNSDALDPLKDFQQIDEGGDIFKQMFKYSIIPTIIHDMEMNIINANDSAIAEFGYTRDELLKKSVFELHTETEIEHSNEVLNEMQKKKKLSVETSFKRKNGSVFMAEATPCKFMLGEKPVIHVFIQDITERKLALKKIQDFNKQLESQVAKRTAELNIKNKELESFSYSVSHDLRAPLRAITGYTEILMEDFLPYLNKEGKKILNTIQKNTMKMSQLIDDILMLSRLNRQEVILQNINMNEVFKSVYKDLTQEIKGRKIDFKLDELKNCKADNAMINQLVTNLLSNAIKYTRHKDIAKIQVSNYEQNGECIYSIKDNGVGFNMQYYKKLFGVFERLHSEREFEGTGIGLSIVKKVIDYHNGRVWAESELDKGTTFYFTINDIGADCLGSD